MNNVFVKDIKAQQIKIIDKENQTQYKIEFGFSENFSVENSTITLSGEGSLKCL